MKKNLLLRLFPLAALAALPAFGQVPVNRMKYPDFTTTVKADPALATPRNAQRPSRVNNAENKYFPPVFNQAGGSCGSASRIGYMFNYEINALRDADASLAANQYPTHFTWLLTNSNSGKEGMAAANGIPNVITYGGRTYSALFGNQDCSDKDFGWMQGYDKWYAAMKNRILRNGNFPMSVETEEGREAVKNWIWNHNGDTDFKAGGIVGIGVASGGNWQRIPQTEANDANGVTGKYYVQDWGTQVDHALTIVGYDDNIEFDLDGNGVAGETDKDEVGAWIVVNSWGAGWCNNGFIYCPYAKAVPWKGSTSFYTPEVYYARKNYRPLRTIKILMEYTKRSEISLSAGISTDLNATRPERSIQFEHFKYAGDGDGDGVDAEVPMLGRWADGLHHEPMEFGYDLTDLSAQFDTRRPLKYFFVIDRKPTFSGKGKIHSCSIIDYEFDQEGIETAFNLGENGVEITETDGVVRLSVVVAGEPLNIPLNPTYADNFFTWSAPASSPHTLVGYNVWCADTLAAQVGADIHAYPVEHPDADYKVSARYDMGGMEGESQRTAIPASPYYGSTPTMNGVRSFTNSGFTVNELFAERLDKATVEYWIKPTSVYNWNQQMGPGWGKFMSHTTSAGEFVVGWNTGSNRITTAAGSLRANTWTHVAYTIDGNVLTAYINGEKAGQITGSSSGIGGFTGGFNVGVQGSSGISGQMDEFRVWNTVRSEKDILRMMHAEVADPKNTPHLLLELKMSEKGSEVPVDATGRHTITLFSGTQGSAFDNSLMKDTRALVAKFTLPEEVAYVDQPVAATNLSSGRAVSFKWTVPEEPELTFTQESPTFVFTQPGTKTITLVASSADDQHDTISQQITIQALETPKPSFTLPEQAMLSDRVSFVNTTETPGCSYVWTMTGGTPDKAVTVNAATRYGRPGTYDVTLTATNAAGTTTVTKQVRIFDVAPEVDFEIEPATLLKGEKVKLTDASQHYPEEWFWKVCDRAHHYAFNTQNVEVQLDDPGCYDVELAVANAMGKDMTARKKAVRVCNADGETGLNFSGAQTVTFTTPIAPATHKEFTMDWWIYPKTSTTSTANQIGGSMRNLLVRTQNDGTVVLSIGGKNYYSRSGLATTMDWHHIAVTFKGGVARIFVDGEPAGTFNTQYTDDFPALPAQFTLGGKSAPMTAVIDELRMWNKALTLDEIRLFANEPIQNVAAAEAEHGLALYYNFNQSSGDVIDATTGAHTGVREGFGPDGDAWSKSLGIFSLSTVKREDLSAQFLTNYIAPFLTGEQELNPAAPRYVELLTGTETSTWTMENADVTGDVTTTFGVDTENGNRLSLVLKQDDFADKLVNHKLYQTVTLPAGHYVFGIATETPSSMEDSYIVAAAGTGLPSAEELKTKALSYEELNLQEIPFSLYKEQEVSLGLLTSISGERNVAYDRFYLERKLTNDDFTWTGIGDAPATGDAVQVQVVSGGLQFTVVGPKRVIVYTLAGTAAFNGVVNGTQRVALPAGLYIVGNNKYVVR